MLIRQLFDQDTNSYTYLLADCEAREALIIDPVLTQIDTYKQLLNELDLSLLYSIDTHVHADHITAAAVLKSTFQCQIVLGVEAPVEGVDVQVRDGDLIKFGRHFLKAVATPGHTAESYCFYSEADARKMVFTGDTLLIRGTGRTDFQNGDAARQYESITQRLLTMPEETIVYPGHDYRGWTQSTIGEEKRHNPRLQVENVNDYIALMENLKLPYPKYMDIAVPSNLRSGKSVIA